MNLKTFVTLILVTFSFSAFAQDINQAGEIYNQGNEALKAGNYEVALQKYEESIKLASTLGVEGEQLVSGAKANIPTCYYQLGIAAYKKKNYDGAMTQMESSIKYGKEYNDLKTVSKAESTIPKLYYSRGLTFYKGKDYSKAIEDFNKAIELNPNFAKAYRLIGLSYSEVGEKGKMLESFSTGLEIAEKEGDSETAKKIKSAAKSRIQKEGTMKLQAQNWDEALPYFNELLKYDPDNKDNFYYLAMANNGLKNWDEAINSAQKGLSFSSEDSDEYKAKFYYELGNAFKGSGQIDKACEAYKNASYGDFVTGAEYLIKEDLKCK